MKKATSKKKVVAKPKGKEALKKGDCKGAKKPPKLTKA